MLLVPTMRRITHGTAAPPAHAKGSGVNGATITHITKKKRKNWRRRAKSSGGAARGALYMAVLLMET